MNYEKYVSSKYFHSFDWIAKIITVNILWVFINTFGLVIFTFLPSTIAAYLIIVNIVEKRDYPTISSFFRIFKREYVKSQKIFMVLLIIGSILGFSLYTYYFNIDRGLFYLLTFYFILILSFLYLIMCVHIIPVFIHFPNLKPLKVIKYAFLLSIGLLFHSVLIIIIHIVTYFIFSSSRILIPVIPFLLVSLNIYLSFKIIAKKYKDLINIEDLDVLDILKYYKVE